MVANGLEVVEQVTPQDQLAVYDQIIDTFISINRLLAGDPLRERFQQSERAILRPAFDRIGWGVKPGEPAPHAFVIEDHASGGALLATGLLAPGVAGLLSVGVVQKQAVAVEDALQTRAMAYLGLTYDPRVVDEGQAGKFMAELKRLLEVVSFS